MRQLKANNSELDKKTKETNFMQEALKKGIE